MLHSCPNLVFFLARARVAWVLSHTFLYFFAFPLQTQYPQRFCSRACSPHCSNQLVPPCCIRVNRQVYLRCPPVHPAPESSNALPCARRSLCSRGGISSIILRTQKKKALPLFSASRGRLLVWVLTPLPSTPWLLLGPCCCVSVSISNRYEISTESWGLINELD